MLETVKASGKYILSVFYNHTRHDCAFQPHMVVSVYMVIELNLNISVMLTNANRR